MDLIMVSFLTSHNQKIPRPKNRKYATETCDGKTESLIIAASTTVEQGSSFHCGNRTGTSDRDQLHFRIRYYHTNTKNGMRKFQWQLSLSLESVAANPLGNELLERSFTDSIKEEGDQNASVAAFQFALGVASHQGEQYLAAVVRYTITFDCVLFVDRIQLGSDETHTDGGKSEGNEALLDFIHHIVALEKHILMLKHTVESKDIAHLVKAGFKFIAAADDRYEFELDMGLYRKKQWQIDAFSFGPFTGNPAGVVCNQFDDALMQSIATENNLAETSFIQRRNSEAVEYDLRWYNLFVINVEY
jgi:hypothetical protein